MICNMVAGGDDALRDKGQMRAALRSLITRSLPDTQQICTVTENTAVRAAHKPRIRGYCTSSVYFFTTRMFAPFSLRTSSTKKSIAAGEH